MYGLVERTVEVAKCTSILRSPYGSKNLYQIFTYSNTTATRIFHTIPLTLSLSCRKSTLLVMVKRLNRFWRGLFSQCMSVRVKQEGRGIWLSLRTNRVHCDSKPLQNQFNHNYDMTLSISPRECQYSLPKIRIWCSKREPFRVVLPIFTSHGAPWAREI